MLPDLLLTLYFIFEQHLLPYPITTAYLLCPDLALITLFMYKEGIFGKSVFAT